MELPAGHAPEASLPIPSAQGGSAAAIPQTSATLNVLCFPDSQDVGPLSASSPHTGVLLRGAIARPKVSAQS